MFTEQKRWPRQPCEKEARDRTRRSVKRAIREEARKEMHEELEEQDMRKTTEQTLPERKAKVRHLQEAAKDLVDELQTAAAASDPSLFDKKIEAALQIAHDLRQDLLDLTE